jgi:hypothetical protein
MKKLYLYILVVALLIGSCSDNNRSSLLTTKVNGKSIPILKFKEVKDTISLSVSQLFDNVSFIKLETNNENLLSTGKWSIGKKYFIMFSYKLGIFQFDTKGKFIRKVVNMGNGPNEVSNPIWTISEDESEIFIYDSNSSKNILCFDLNSGHYLHNIPVAIEGKLKNIYLINDSILVCAPIIGTGQPAGKFYVFWQNLEGKLIHGLPSPEKKYQVVNDQDLLYPVGNHFHYRPVDGDTIFLVKNYQMEPCFIFDRQNDFHNQDEVGWTTFSVLAETTDLLIVSTSTIKERVELGPEFGPNAYRSSGISACFYVDKISNKPFLISTFYNDFLGEMQNPSQLRNQTGDQKYFSIEAISLLKRINEIKMDSQIKIKNRDEILKLEIGLKESDNPILLVGKFMKK